MSTEEKVYFLKSPRKHKLESLSVAHPHLHPPIDDNAAKMAPLGRQNAWGWGTSWVLVNFGHKM